MNTTKDYEYILYIKEIEYIFYLLNGILYLKTYKDKKEMYNEKIANNIMQFSVDINEFGNISIIAISFFGKLNYIYNEDEKWKNREIQNYNLKKYKVKEIKLYMYENTINVFMYVENKLLYYNINSNDIKEYKIIDGIEDNYKMDIDKMKNIHLIYSLTKNKKQLVYRRFNLEYKTWTTPEKITNSYEYIKNICILCDTYNCVHIIFFSKYNNDIKINYLYQQIKSHFTSNWNKYEKNINIKGDFYNTSLIQLNDCFRILWIQNEEFAYINNKMESDFCAEIKKTNIKANENFVKAIFIGDNYKNFEKVKIPIIYKYPIKEGCLIGVDDIYEPLVAITLEEDISNIRYSLREYIDNLSCYFEKSNVILDLFSNKEKRSIQMNNDEIISKYISNIYNELNNLKLNQAELINYLDEMKKDYIKLEEKLKNISIENHINKQKIEEINILKRGIRYIMNLLNKEKG